MKKPLLIILLMLFCFAVKAQQTTVNADTLVYTAVEKEPTFPGGMNQFGRYLVKKLRYPADSRIHNIRGTVIIQFIVEKDGSLSNIHVIRGVAEDLNQEALRLLRNSPKWIAGTQNGVPVRAMYTVPVSFQLADR